jgi:hypothetical protein
MQRHIVKHGTNLLQKLLMIGLRGKKYVAQMSIVLTIRRHAGTPYQALLFERRRQFVVTLPAGEPSRVIRSDCSNRAQRNAAVISFGRNEEPTSCQVYLSTSPRKNRLRSVPSSNDFALREIGIPQKQAAAFTRNDVLGFMENCRYLRSRRARAPLARHHALSRVLGNAKIVAPGDRNDGIHLVKLSSSRSGSHSAK